MVFRAFAAGGYIAVVAATFAPGGVAGTEIVGTTSTGAAGILLARIVLVRRVLFVVRMQTGQLHSAGAAACGARAWNLFYTRHRLGEGIVPAAALVARALGSFGTSHLSGHTGDGGRVVPGLGAGWPVDMGPGRGVVSDTGAGNSTSGALAG